MASSSSSLSSALSSMELMLDALRQRGIGKLEDKPKEEEPPALPTRPTVRGRPPSIHRPASDAPWSQRPPLAPLPPPPEEEEAREAERRAVELELERRAVRAEEEAKQKDDDVRLKEEEIAGLRQQVELYEARLAEWEAKMKAVEEELQRQTAALQMSQAAAAAAAARAEIGSTSHRREPTLSDGVAQAERAPAPTRAEEAAVKRGESLFRGASVKPQQQQPAVATVLSSNSKPSHAEHHLATEYARETQAFEHAARAVAEVKPGTMSVDELKMLRRQFAAWKKEYEARLRKTNAELKKRVHSEKSHDQQPAHGGRRRWCGWWRTIKAPKFRAPKRCCTCACAMKLPSFPSCKFPSLPSCKFPSLPSCSFSCCCFRRRR
ncbi:myosin-2-like [Triticum dicoccoides]|uniref:myosin-2-like n=1 Tax=Triticum dicoccoides TaxID=85692 RepID=UPI0018907EC5|nr:myosin-2-like [Triticum dicoccoides]